MNTCGARRASSDIPIDAENYCGDPSFREIPQDARPGVLLQLLDLLKRANESGTIIDSWRQWKR